MTKKSEFGLKSGAVTYMRSPRATMDEIEPGMTVISGAPHSMRDRFGERYGPRGIRENSLSIADRFERAGGEGVVDTASGKVLALPSETRLVDVGDFGMHPSDVMKATESMASGVAEVVRRGGFSVCLGGDHYVGYPSCLGYTRALTEQRPNAKVGYVHIDGHLDFAEGYEGGGRFNNGTNAKRISELDPMVESSMVWIGIQGPCNMDEVEPIRRMGGHIFTSEDVEEMGPAEVGRRACELALKGSDYIYMSFDIDVIDAGFSDGTGSVTMGAMPPSTLFKILEPIAEYPIGAFDLVETAPPLDPANRTPRYAAEALLKLITPKILDVH